VLNTITLTLRYCPLIKPEHASTNKTVCHDTTEILLKVALNSITLTQQLKNVILIIFYFI
jgi:hypothetical protein